MAATPRKKAPARKKAGKPAPKQKYRVVSTRVPEDLWRDVKVHCSRTDVTVQEFVVGQLRRGVKS
jgi:hypothetical protein